jgi:phosphatidylserine/phosphatidylglycerophosphate/cardiolipin synthase-like enzyme
VTLELISGRGHYERVIDRVIAARRSVWIATANLKELMVEDPRARPGRRRTLGRRAAAYRSMLDVFDELVARGVEIRVLHAGEPSRPFRDELRRHPTLARGRGPARDGGAAAAGSFALRRCPRVHLKLVVIDGAQIYLGSANWTGAGLGVKGDGRRNFELGVVTGDDLMLDEAQALYDHIWRGAACRGCKLRDVCPGPLDLDEARSKMG